MRICHRILVINTVLKEIGIVDACSFCEKKERKKSRLHNRTLAMGMRIYKTLLAEIRKSI